MAKKNTYEEARQQRLEENNQRLQELGIEKISKTLSQLSNSVQKSPKQRLPKPKSIGIINIVEPRRSSRARNSVTSYRDDVDIELLGLPKRSRSKSSSWASYLARPLEEVKTASYEERVRALKAAEQLEGSLQSGFPSFIKSMVRSHVYSCFWLGLPSQFCKDNLPKTVTDMVLEDENDKEYDAVFIGRKSGLSGGWRAFALDHKLDDGDALVFELVEPTRFKVYIIRASSISSQEHEDGVIANGFTSTAKKTRSMKIKSQPKHSHEESEETSLNKLGNAGTNDGEPSEETGSASAPKKIKRNGKPSKDSKLEKVVLVEEKDKSASLRPRRKPAPKSFRKKAY